MLKLLIIEPKLDFARLLGHTIKSSVPNLKININRSYKEGLVTLQKHPDVQIVVATFVDKAGDQIFDHLVELHHLNPVMKFYLYTPGHNHRAVAQCREYTSFGVSSEILTENAPVITATLVRNEFS